MSPAVRRWGPWALLVAVAVAVLIVGVQRNGGPPSLQSRVQHISSEVRCPVCNGETVAQSQAAPSVEIRNQITSDLQKGQSEGQILSYLVASYGPGILEKPQARGVSLLVWALPVVGVVIAAAGLLALLRRWQRTSRAAVVADDPPVMADDPPVVADDPPVVAGAPAAGQDAAAGDTAPVTREPPPARAAGPSRRTKTILACAGVVLVAGGASWAVAASSGTRLPGQTISGQALGAPAEAAALDAAHSDENRNDVVDAVKQYQKVLASDPKQVEALSGEGWLLAETGQPALLKQGLSLLAQAEQVQPDYPAAHLYRGLALLGEADYSDSVPELQWYLAHNPDPQLAPQVRKALDQAKAGVATQATLPSRAAPAGG